MSAENVKLLPKGTIPAPVCSGPTLDGVVVRPLRCFNPDQSHYAGLIQCVSNVQPSSNSGTQTTPPPPPPPTKSTSGGE